jgi:hypothetical protein
VLCETKRPWSSETLRFSFIWLMCWKSIERENSFRGRRQATVLNVISKKTSWLAPEEGYRYRCGKRLQLQRVACAFRLTLSLVAISPQSLERCFNVSQSGLSLQVSLPCLRDVAFGIVKTHATFSTIFICEPPSLVFG